MKQGNYTMKISQIKLKSSEHISLDKPIKIENNAILSQNAKAVTPNGLNWLFLRPSATQSGAGVSPSYTDLATSKRFPLMVWLILQNKPIGEYAKRLLLQPRVRPHRPNLGLLLKIAKGAFPMNTQTPCQTFTFVGTSTPQPQKPSNKPSPKLFFSFWVRMVGAGDVYFDDFFVAFAHANYLKHQYPLAKVQVVGVRSLMSVWQGDNV